ncbi:hypothetical protein OUZ56_002946 [Daphnia magna]|uniref:Uncharacterized protein n=1 Tax=Daphnia magna TaxID=35525 RepID=A0ABR0A790_9CRUS|nr:hypothetical protein OUZ56_002946 [Daphnia magna]
MTSNTWEPLAVSSHAVNVDRYCSVIYYECSSFFLFAGGFEMLCSQEFLNKKNNKKEENRHSCMKRRENISIYFSLAFAAGGHNSFAYRVVSLDSLIYGLIIRKDAPSLRVRAQKKKRSACATPFPNDN